jgi:plasmid stabilization system protein ParE
MSWRLERSGEFWDDYGHRFRWYFGEGGETLAVRFAKALDETLDRLLMEPTLGHKRRFKHPMLQGLRSIPLQKPFDNFLLFYRLDAAVIEVWRLMHGAQDLGNRLLEPND